MKKIFLSSLFLIFTYGTAIAGGSCYSPSEIRAEQLLRLHSELMVITVTCHTGTLGENLVPAYTGFTKNNIKILHEAEQVMVRFFEGRNGGDGIEKLDKLRTELANEIGQRSANISAPAFCQQYRDKVLQFNQADSTQVQDAVSQMVMYENSYVHACDEEAQVATKTK